MRKWVFWSLLVLLVALAGVLGAGCQWGLITFNVMGISHASEEAKFIYWGLVGAFIGYLVGAVVAPSRAGKGAARKSAGTA
jgi:hypothetical protein